jgi:hypothetical protein
VLEELVGLGGLELPASPLSGGLLASRSVGIAEGIRFVTRLTFSESVRLRNKMADWFRRVGRTCPSTTAQMQP